jgi:hypothetical protein
MDNVQKVCNFNTPSSQTFRIYIHLVLVGFRTCPSCREMKKTSSRKLLCVCLHAKMCGVNVSSSFSTNPTDQALTPIHLTMETSNIQSVVISLEWQTMDRFQKPSNTNIRNGITALITGQYVGSVLTSE